MKTRLESGKKMKKKGFTLIELLAVIVILAIIALIAVPVVMNIINKANKSAFKDSAYGLLKAGESYYTSELLEDAEGMTDDKVFDFSNDTSDLEINGSKPIGGTMTVRKDGKISMAIHNGKHCVKKGFEEDDVTITDDIENCEMRPKVNTLSDLATTGTFEFTYGASPVEVNEVHACAKSGICEPGTAFAIKVNDTQTHKFYVLNDTGKKLTLIMDRNLYIEGDPKCGDIEWINAEDYALANSEEGDNTICELEACTDEGPITALKALKERTKTWKNIPVITTDSFEDEAGNKYSMNQSFTIHARLPRHAEIKKIYEQNNDRIPNYLSIDSGLYYTSTVENPFGENPWAVCAVYFDEPSNNPDLDCWEGTKNMGNNFCGWPYSIRPVIELSK